jgi:hypothetical protein
MAVLTLPLPDARKTIARKPRFVLGDIVPESLVEAKPMRPVAIL